MGMSFKLRVMGIVVMTFFIAWTMLRSTSEAETVTLGFPPNDNLHKAAPAPTVAKEKIPGKPSSSPPADNEFLSAKIDSGIPAAAHKAVADKAVSDKAVSDKAVSDKAVSNKDMSDKSLDKQAANSEKVPAALSTPLMTGPFGSRVPDTQGGVTRPDFVPVGKAAKLPEGTSKGDTAEAKDEDSANERAKAEPDAAKDKAEEKNIKDESGEKKDKGTDEVKDATQKAEEPEKPHKKTEAEMTEKEKEEEKKRKEKAAERRKHELEQKHNHMRDEKLKQFKADPEMQARFKVTPEDIGVILRTGDNVKHRLSGPLSTWASNRTSENTVFFSDKESKFQGWRLQDAIKPWLDRPAIKDTDAAKFWREHNTAESVVKPPTDGKKKRFDAWNLDALKFVSAAHLGYLQLREKRDFKWYIFADDDTYWHLPTLASLVSNLDYEDEYYMGGVSYFGIPFAHGGAGAVASAAAMKTRFVDHADTIVQYHDIGATAQYGDTNLARAFEAVDIFFDHSFRDMFNSESPFQRGLDRGLICQHVVTYHHLHVDYFPKLHERIKDLPVLTYMKVMSLASAEDKPITEYWRKHDWSYNLDIKDTGVAKDAKEMRDNNWSFTVPPKHKDIIDAQSCQEMCRDHRKCVAWTYIPDERTCLMSEWFRLGHTRKGCVSGVDAMQFTDWVEQCKPWWPQ
ncbi:Predicted protein [Taphrina deformans PYCC 5710]|uniref:Apple domain-containing protein n=1 Tax=Taphrina deformans (strain PYCC 5710 / ATCC 11124 / CBS 356.35 / IMI 108563 / JCM 9778 / NBRC 8474) TaxID=1097556 RepID=R4XL66_TAPDE|nr:Predicted protein [Taphrina deformans PYCC 5710]|eukprot:CCG85135.1 Predicted protein [Taphrina deformans PYCC 5710]